MFYKLFEKGFLKYLHKKNGKAISKESLVFSFPDLDGNSYYKFPKELALPMVRLAKLQEYLQWLSAGVTGTELDKMLDNCETALMDGLKNNKGFAKIGFVLSELRDRKKMIIHDELFYNIIAVQIIRHDELPTVFNNQIQMEKVEAFRRLNETNDSFFLNINEYLIALNWSNITKDELMKVLNDSTIHREASEKMIQRMFGNLSQEQMKTLSSL